MLVRSRTYRFLYSFGGLFFKFCTVVIFLGSLFVACNKSPQTKIVKEPAGRDGGGGNPRKPEPDKFIGLPAMQEGAIQENPSRTNLLDM